MKKLLYIFSLFLCISCTTVKEVPVEVVKTEYVNIHTIDTIIQNSTTYIKDIGDTVFIYNKEYIYKYRDRADTLIVKDTITNYIDRIEYVEVNKLKNWQKILMLLGGGVLALLLFKLVMLIKK